MYVRGAGGEDGRERVMVNLPLVIGGRLLVGIGGGMATVVVPVYIAEIVPARLRALTCLHQLGIAAGFTLSYGVGWSATDATSTEFARDCFFCGWRLAGWLGMVPAFLGWLVVALWLPESPRWLMQRGPAGVEQAKAVLLQLRGTRQQVLMAGELAEMQRTAALSCKDATDYSWRTVQLRTRFTVAVTVAMATQIGGGFDSFVTPMETAKLKPGLQSLGLGHLSPRTLTILIAVFAMLMLAIGAGLCELLGRRRLFLASSVSTAIASACLGLATALGSSRGVGPLPLSAIEGAGTIVYVFAYNLGMAGVGWAIIVEILPTRWRATGVGAAVMARWLAAFTIAMLNTFLEIWPKWLLFVVEAAFLVITSLLGWYALGETKGRSLEHLDLHLRRPRFLDSSAGWI